VLSSAAAIITGYLLGSIPSGYLISWLVARKDIRRLGGGNIGALNAYMTLGKVPAAGIFIMDLGKVVGAIAIAFWLLHASPLFVMLVALAAVIGHIWMVFLKFSGGRGMAVSLGAVLMLFPIYGYWQGAPIFLGIIAIPFFITRNVPLSMFTAILFLPLVVWMLTNSWQATIMSIVLGLLVGGKFFPTARAAWTKAGSLKNFIFVNNTERHPNNSKSE